MGEMLLGAALLLSGMGIGWLWPARRKAVKPRKPICGCECDLAFHEPDGEGGGTICHGTHEVQAPRPDYNTPMRYITVPCTCKQYTGIRILDPGYTARELA